MSQNIDRGEHRQDEEPQHTTAIEDRAVSRREFMKLAGLAGAGLTMVGGLGGILAACGSAATTTTTAATTATTTATTATTGSVTTAATAGGTTTSAASSGTIDAASLKKMLNIPDGAAAGQGLTLNLGSALPLSGGGAFYGEHQASGIKLAIPLIEAMGGPHFNVTFYDIQMGVAQLGVDAIRKMASSDTHMALVGWCAASGAEIAPAEQNKILLVDGGGGTSVGWQGKDFFWGTRAIPTVDSVRGTLLYVKQKLPDAKNVALLTQSYGTQIDTPIDETAKKNIEDLGFTHVGTVLVPLDAVEFSDAINKLKAMKPDIIFGLPLDGPAPVAFMKQYATSGMKAMVVCTDYTVDNAKLAGSAYENNYWYSGEEFLVAQPGSPWTKYFIDTYHQNYKGEPDAFVANFYEDTFLLWDLVRRVIAKGGDPKDGAALQAELIANPTFMSVYGGTADAVGTYSLDLKIHSVASKTNYIFAIKDTMPDLLGYFQGPSGDSLKIIK